MSILLTQNNIFLWILFMEKVFFYWLVESMFGRNKGRSVGAFQYRIKSGSSLREVQDSFSKNVEFDLGLEIVAWEFFGSHALVFVEGEDFKEEFFSNFGEFLFLKYFGNGFWLDFFDELLLSFGPPWGVACEHFKEDDSNGPEIGFVGVLIFFEWLGSHVKWGANVVFAGFGEFLALNAKAKICYFKYFIISDQEIGRLEVSVYNLMVVDFFVSIKKLCHVEAGFGFGEFGLDDFIHIRRAEFCNEISVVFGGEDIKEGENTGFVF